MNIIDINEVKPSTEITSFEDTAMFLNLFYPELVDEILEAFTDACDFDIIEEIVNTLKLKITAVIEVTQKGLLLHGYINEVMV